jgi:hypothetical protein
MNRGKDSGLFKIDTLIGFGVLLLTKFPLLLGLLSIVALGFATYILTSRQVELTVNGSAILSTPRTGHAEYRGFYRDINPNLIPDSYVAFEDLSLDFYQSGKIAGLSAGETSNNTTITKKEWRIDGFVSGEYRFMSYVTTRVNGSPSVQPSVGAYILQQRGTNVFVGYIVFRDTTYNVTVQCPYILTEELRMSVDAAEKRWKPLREKCEPINFPIQLLAGQ